MTQEERSMMDQAQGKRTDLNLRASDGPQWRGATTLGSFEKLVLDLFDNHLREPERGAAVKKFVGYIKVCHAMLDSGLVKESELTH
jgi:hypothetical protein